MAHQLGIRRDAELLRIYRILILIDRREKITTKSTEDSKGKGDEPQKKRRGKFLSPTITVNELKGTKGREGMVE